MKNKKTITYHVQDLETGETKLLITKENSTIHRMLTQKVESIKKSEAKSKKELLKMQSKCHLHPLCLSIECSCMDQHNLKWQKKNWNKILTITNTKKI